MVTITKLEMKSILTSKFFNINYLQTSFKKMVEFGTPQEKLHYWIFDDVETIKKTNFDLAHILYGMDESSIRVIMDILEHNSFDEVAEDLSSIFLELRNNC